MQIFKLKIDIKEYVFKCKKNNKKIGFIPTMGALHQGHISLIKKAKKQCDIIIVSIFINPTQFNDKEDYINYPKTINNDIDELLKCNVDALFYPNEEEIYNKDEITKNYNLDYLENILEGKFRKNHFQGVCQIIDIFLKILNPDILYLGQKDFQQCIILKKLIEKIFPLLKLEICETLREESGLAMSSRNVRLNKEDKLIAPLIYKNLNFIKQNINNSIENFNKLKEESINNLSLNNITTEYLELVDFNTLLPIFTNENLSNKKILLLACKINGIRLIDNIII